MLEVVDLYSTHCRLDIRISCYIALVNKESLYRLSSIKIVASSSG
jgi:hypothetical protein